MIVWLFEDLDIKDPRADFKRFKTLLKTAIGGVGSDLYYPMKIFEKEKEKHAHSYAESFAKRFGELRDKLFAERTVIENCETIDQMSVVASNVFMSCETIYNDLLFVLATMPEEYRWIGSCDIHKQTTGVLSGTTNEFCHLLHILKHLEKKCK